MAKESIEQRRLGFYLRIGEALGLISDPALQVRLSQDGVSQDEIDNLIWAIEEIGKYRNAGGR